MHHARTALNVLGVSILLGLAGCGGGSTPTNDTGPGPGNDTGPAGNDTGPATTDAGSDAGSSDVDAFVDVDAASDIDTGTMASGACTNTADEDVLAAGTVPGVLDMCARNNIINAGARRMCIENMTGLTMACADCFADSVDCGIMHCSSQCAANPDGTPCRTCIDTNCTPALETCSGIAM